MMMHLERELKWFYIVLLTKCVIMAAMWLDYLVFKFLTRSHLR